MTAATIAGPGTGTLPGLAVLATVAVGSPWWWNQDRRRLVRVRRVMEHFPDTAQSAGLDGAQMVSAVLDPWGWTARLKLRRGQHARNAIDAVPALESALGTRVGAVRIEPVPSDAAEVVLRVVETDPHAKPIPWPDPAASAGKGRLGGSITRPVTLGVWEDGSPVQVSLLRRHVLIGGTTGSGKSGLVNVILAGLSGCADVVLWGVDLKEGMELRPWVGCLGRLATTAQQAVSVLQAGVAELERRAAWMAEHGYREWAPTPHAPALVIVVDEYAELPKAARVLADSIARRGRAVAVTLLVATQRPTQKAMGEGTAIRSQMDVRVCLRVRERADIDLILGAGMLTAGWDSTGFDAPGKFLLSAPGHDSARRARAYLITDNQVKAVAKAATAAARTTPDSPEGDRPGETAGGTAASTAERAVDGIEAPRQDQHTGEPEESVSGPDVALWAALWTAGDNGVSVAELVTACGMSRAWVYGRLKEHQQTGHVLRTSRGRWRAAPPADPTTDPPPDSSGGHEA